MPEPKSFRKILLQIQVSRYIGIWTLLEPKYLSLLVRCPYFRERIITHLYEVGTRSNVLINQVCLFQGCPLREVQLYNSIVHLTDPFSIQPVH